MASHTSSVAVAVHPAGVSPTRSPCAVAALVVEIVGVLAVGALSLAREDLFPDQTVWSDFGIGYGFIPLVLPIAGLSWLMRPSTRRQFGH